MSSEINPVLYYPGDVRRVEAPSNGDRRNKGQEQKRSASTPSKPPDDQAMSDDGSASLLKITV